MPTDHHDRNQIVQEQRHPVFDTGIAVAELTRAGCVAESVSLQAVDLIRVYSVQQATANSLQPEKKQVGRCHETRSIAASA